MVAGIDALEKHMFGDLPPEKTAAFMEMLELIERRARLAREMVELNGKAGLARLLGGDAG
jgi:hypothetical protein